MKGAQILVGDTEGKNSYVDSLINENKIPSYYVKRYEDTLKIAEARLLIKELSQKIEEDKFRLFIFEKSPTIEAQNSLLKTLEELDKNSIFIFMDDNLLPTITSRSFVINLGNLKNKLVVSESDLILVDKYLLKSKSLTDRLLFVDSFFIEKRNDYVGELILLLRNFLLNSRELSISFLQTIRDLSEVYPLVKNNNLSARLVCERVLLENFRKD